MSPLARLFAITLLSLTIGVLASCSRRQTPAARPTSNVGSVRIVSLSPAAADITQDLGLAGSLVGRNSADVWTDHSVASCGELGRIDYEALLAARPTHVFVQEPAMPPRLESLAAQHGFVALNLSLLTLDEIRTSARRIVDSLPTGPQAAARSELTRVEQAMDRAWSAAANDRGRVLLLASVDPPAALGPGSFHYQILQRLGGTPVPAAGSPYITLSAEDVVALAPDAIILITPRDPGASPRSLTPDSLLASLGVLSTLDIPAVRSRRIALIDDPKAHLPSTAMIALADRMRAILESWSTINEPRP